MDPALSMLPVSAFVVAALAHNLEESVALPSWSRRAGIPWVPPVRDLPFRFAASCLSLAVVGVGVGALLAGPASALHYLLLAFAVGHALNVLVPHVAVTALSRRYMPGLGTGVVLVLPAAVWVLLQGLAFPEVRTGPLVITVVVAVPGVLASIPLLLKLGGRILESRGAGRAQEG